MSCIIKGMLKNAGKEQCVKEKVKLQELTSISSYTEEIIRQGMTPSRKLLSFGLRVCTEEEAEQLGLKKSRSGFFYGANLFCGRIAIMSDEHSVALSIIQRD